MKNVILALALLTGWSHLAAADSGSAMVVDAGAGSGSAAPVVTPAALAPVPDPITDPAAYLTRLEAAKSIGWPLFILVGVFGLCEVLAAAGKNVAALAWLGTGRVSIVIGAGVSILAAAINSLATGGTWMAVGATALGALLLYVHPAAKDVAAKQVADKQAAAGLA